MQKYNNYLFTNIYYVFHHYKYNTVLSVITKGNIEYGRKYSQQYIHHSEIMATGPIKIFSGAETFVNYLIVINTCDNEKLSKCLM